jgi:CHAT domain-containing protein
MSPEEAQRFKNVFFSNQDFKTGYEFHVEGNIVKAREYYTKAMYTLREESNWLGMIKVGGRVVTTYSGSNNDSLGIAIADTLLATIDRSAPSFRDATAPIYKGLLNLYYDRGANETGIASAHRLRSLLLKEHQTDILNSFVDIYGLVGFMHSSEGRIDSALYYLKTAHDIIPKLEKVSPDKASFTLYLYGSVLFNIGQYGKAIDMVERATEYALQVFGNGNPEMGRYYAELASQYNTLGEYESSISYQQKAIYHFEGREGLPDIFYQHLIPNAHLIQCSNYIEIKQLEKARYHYEKAMEYLQHLEKEVALSSSVSHVKGDLLVAQGTARQAIPYYFKTKSLHLKNIANGAFSYFSNDYQLMTLEADIAHAYQASEMLDSAIVSYKAAIAIAYELPAESIAQLKSSLNRKLAGVYMDMHELDSALHYNQIALKHTCLAFDSDNYFTLPPASDFNNTTASYQALLQKINLLYQLAEQQKEKERKIDILLQAVSFTELADEVHVEQLKKASLYRTAKSTTLVNNSIDIYRKGLRLTYELNRLTGDNKYLAQGFYFTQKMKAQQLWMSLLDSKSKNIAGLDKTLLDEERDLLADIALYESMIRTAIAEKDAKLAQQYKNDHLFAKRQELTRLYRKMEAEYPEYYAAKYNFMPENQNSLNKILNDDEVLIEYILVDSSLFTFVLSTDHPLKLYHTKAGTEFTDQVNELNTLLKHSSMLRSSSRQRFVELSRQLHANLLQPISQSLKEKERLIIIGDGLINYIPFEVLLVSAESSSFDEMDYLITHFEILYNYSTTLFAKARKTQPNQNEGLFAFAPIYDEEETTSGNTAMAINTDNLRAFQQDGSFSPLPESEKEVENIARIYQEHDRPFVAFFREQANEARLKAQLSQPHRYIHLAGHSFADLKNPNFSGVACYPDTTDTEEDGILYTGELYGLNTSADLVTLSSCESGLGKLQGTEGLLGLNRSFVYAGAQNVVYSLWKVYDKVSAQMMVDFYTGIIEEGLSYSSSLRRAKLTQISNPATASPHYWGAYLLIGR